MGETVAAGPVWTLRTLLPLGVVNSLFMRAADDAVGDDGGAHAVLLNKLDDLRVDIRVEAHVAIFRKEALQMIGFRSLAQKNGNRSLARPFRGRAVQGYSGDGITLESAFRELLQTRGWSSDSLHGRNEIPDG